MDLDYNRGVHGFRSPERVSTPEGDEGEVISRAMLACMEELDKNSGDFGAMCKLAEKWDPKIGICDLADVPRVLPMIVRLFGRCPSVELLRVLTSMVVWLSAKDPGLLRLMSSGDEVNFLACLHKSIEATRDVELMSGLVSITGNFFAMTTRDDAEVLARMCHVREFFCISDSIEFDSRTQKFFQKFIKSMFQFCSGDHVDVSSAEFLSAKSSDVIGKCGCDFQCARMYCWIHVKLLERDLLSVEQASQLDFSRIIEMSPEIREDGAVTLVLGRILQKFHGRISIDLTLDEVLSSAADFFDQQSGPVALWVAQMLADHESAQVFVRMADRFQRIYDSTSIDFKTELVALLWVFVGHAPESAPWFFHDFLLMDKTTDVISSAPVDAVRQICELILASMSRLDQAVLAEIWAQRDTICHSLEAYNDNELDLFAHQLFPA